jgi:hypothetical protein
VVALIGEGPHEFNDVPQQTHIYRLTCIKLISQYRHGADYLGNHPMLCFEHFGWTVRHHVGPLHIPLLLGST